MKFPFFIFIMLLAHFASSQVIDSVKISTDIFYNSGHNNLLNLGEDGFIIYGTKANQRKGLSFYSKTFNIRYYDASFHEVEEKNIELSANGIQASVSVYL